MFDHQTLQNAYGDLLDLSKLLHSSANLPQQEPDQEMIPAEVIGQRVVKLQVCEETCECVSGLIVIKVTKNMFGRKACFSIFRILFFHTERKGN